MSNQDLIDQVSCIVETLENPQMYCQSCGETHGELADCPACGEELFFMDAYEYLKDVLDVEYTVSSEGEYLGARLLVCFGGPNVWIDTRHNRVEGHWWADSYSANYCDEMGLDECMRELYECR